MGSENSESETYVEFSRVLSTLFGCLRLASEVQTFDQLCELLLLEQFKATRPKHMTIYVGERNVKTLSDAGVIADDYALTHKGWNGHRIADSAISHPKRFWIGSLQVRKWWQQSYFWRDLQLLFRQTKQ